MYENSTHTKILTQRKQMHYSPNLLSTVSNAIDNHKVATIEHDSYEKGISIRDVEPLAVVFKDGKRNLVGWCRLRNEYRSFRLERINSIKLNKEEFTSREDFRIEDFQDDPNAVYQEHYEEVA